MKCIAILVALLAAREAQADCGCWADLMTPTVAEGTPQLVFEASCITKPPVFTLRAHDGSTIATKLLTSHHGPSKWLQVVLEPAAPLKAGTYTVVTKGLVEDRGTPHLLHVAKPGTLALAWPADPKVTKMYHLDGGCGPTDHVRVAVGATKASLAFVEVVDAVQQTTARGYFRITNGVAVIGRGMCGGPFALVKGRSYQAAITLIAPDYASTSSAKPLAVTFQP